VSDCFFGSGSTSEGSPSDRHDNDDNDVDGPKAGGVHLGRPQPLPRRQVSCRFSGNPGGLFISPPVSGIRPLDLHGDDGSSGCPPGQVVRSGDVGTAASAGLKSFSRLKVPSSSPGSTSGLFGSYFVAGTYPSDGADVGSHRPRRDQVRRAGDVVTAASTTTTAQAPPRQASTSGGTALLAASSSSTASTSRAAPSTSEHGIGVEGIEHLVGGIGRRGRLRAPRAASLAWSTASASRASRSTS